VTRVPLSAERLNLLRQVAAGALALRERLQFPVEARCPLSPDTLAFIEDNPSLLGLASCVFEDRDTLFFEIDPLRVDPLPRWIFTLDALMDHIATVPEVLGDIQGASDSTGIFAPLLERMLDFARIQLKRQDSSDREQSVITHGALDHLGRRLVHLAGRVLATEFKPFRDRNPGNDAWDDYLRALGSGGLLDVFMAYPVLARTLAGEIERWVCRVDEFCTHYEQDRASRGHRFHGSQSGAPLVRFQMGLSDPHRGGRTVCRLDFDSADSIIYKPRSLAAEIAHGEVLKWAFVSLVPGAAFEPLDVLSRPTHGWVRLVQARPCARQEGISRYYHRFGQLIGLHHILGVGDIHPENVIACAEQPCIVDPEVAMRAPLTPQLGHGQDRLVCEMLDSVVFTGMVPVWHQAPGEAVKDTSGWHGLQGAQPAQPRQVWRLSADGRPGLALLRDPPVATHAPSIDGSHAGVAAHAQAVVAGLTSVLMPLVRDSGLRALMIDVIGHCFGDAGVRFAPNLPAVCARRQTVLAAVGLVAPTLLAVHDARLD
jgi:hypothetical protein